MALPKDYWNKAAIEKPKHVGRVFTDHKSGETTIVSGEKYEVSGEEQQVAKNLRAAIGKSQQEHIEKEARRSVVDRMPYELTNVVFGLPEESAWKEMGAIDKTKHLSTQAAKGTWTLAKSLPKEIIKTPWKIEQSIFDLEMAGMQVMFPKIFGKELTREDIQKATGRGIARDVELPFYGKEEIGGVARSYERGIEMGFGKWGAGITAGGELAGDILIGLTGANIVQGFTRPKWTQVPGTYKKVQVAGVDYQALSSKQVASLKLKYYTGKIKAKVFNKDVSYAPLAKDVAKQYGGTPSNTMGKITHIGKGMDELSVVQLRTSLTSRTKDSFSKKFGRSKVVEGEFGPEIKLYSEIIKKDYPTTPAVVPKRTVAKVKPADIPSWEKMTDIQKAEAMGAAPVAERLAKAPEVEVDPFAPIEKPELPSLMRRPTQGSENLAVTDKHIGQVIDLSLNRKLPDGTAQSISKAFNGKGNLNELTRQELYDVSEAVRAFPEAGAKATPWDFNSKISPTMRVLETKNWMSIAEQKSLEAGFNYRPDTDIRVPIEFGILNKRNFHGTWVEEFTKSNNFFGKYSRNKDYEKRRLTAEHIRGDKDAILNNKTLSEKEKADLLKISEQMQKYFKDNKGVFAEASKYGPEFIPEYKVIENSLPAFYKEAEVPTELKVASQFERKGQLNVIVDDPLVFLPIYAEMVAKVRFLKRPYDYAMKVSEKYPENMKSGVDNWMQEVMGRGGELEKQLNTWSESLSKKRIGYGPFKLPKGTIPADLAQSTIRRAMSYSYGAGMGLPGTMPPIRNVYMQSFVFPFMEFGPDYLIWLSQQIVNPKKIAANIKNVQDTGLEVKGGVFYGSELGKATGRGPVGKTADLYEKLNLLALKFYGFSDLFNRSTTSGYTKYRFNRAWEGMKQNKISIDEFEKLIDMESYTKTVQQYLRNNFKKNTKESLKEAEVLLQKEKLDQIQFPYRKGGASSLHYGLGGKMIGQFTQYQWGYATMIGEMVARKQWIKLIRLVGMGEASRRAVADTLGIDISSWVGKGPVKLPVSPMANIFIGTTEEIQNALNDQGNAKEFNKNYKEIMSAAKLYGGFGTGAGATGRWKNVMYSIDRYEKSVSGESMFPLPMDPSNPDRVFGLWMRPIAKDTQPSMIRPVTFGELLSYGFGFQDIRGDDEWSAMREKSKEDEEKRIATKRYIYYLENKEPEKAEDLMIEYQLDGKVILNAIDGQTKSIIQRNYENMSIKDQIKWGPLFRPLIYGE